jgi:hypothetical protein
MEGLSLLLQILEANGGTLGRGELHAAMEKLMDQGYVDVNLPSTPPKTIKDHCTFSYVLTDKGRSTLATLKRITPKVVKEKKGVATILTLNGNRYTLEHPHAFRQTKKGSVASG